MPWKILATARPENFSSLRLDRKPLMSAQIWAFQSLIWEQNTATGFRDRNESSHHKRNCERVTPCICWALPPHLPLHPDSVCSGPGFSSCQNNRAAALWEPDSCFPPDHPYTDCSYGTQRCTQTQHIHSAQMMWFPSKGPIMVRCSVMVSVWSDLRKALKQVLSWNSCVLSRAITLPCRNAQTASSSSAIRSPYERK